MSAQTIACPPWCTSTHRQKGVVLAFGDGSGALYHSRVVDRVDPSDGLPDAMVRITQEVLVTGETAVAAPVQISLFMGRVLELAPVQAEHLARELGWAIYFVRGLADVESAKVTGQWERR